MHQPTTLDPVDWEAFRSQARVMLDAMCDHMRDLRGQPAWQAPPPDVRARHRSPVPTAGSELADVCAAFTTDILPFGSGNAHPGFMGWVQGGGSAVGMLAEMLAGGLNVNAGGRDHMAIEIEQEVIDWTRQLLDFPEGASGLFLTGTSMANFIAVLVARARALGIASRRTGLPGAGRRLTAYASTAVHGCVARALDMAGIGSEALRAIPVDAEYRIRIPDLAARIAEDRASGLHPFLLVGTAGSVDTGSIDDLDALADIAAAEGLSFHVDGAYGALALLAPDLKPRLRGLSRADSVAFDWHKWGQVPYDAGCIMVRDGERLKQTFAADAAYLGRAETGLAAGAWWPCDYGPDLSRGFRALKVWFSLKTYGTDALGAVIARSCRFAQLLSERIADHPELELLAPTQLNVVCFGYRAGGAEGVNAAIVERLHERGRVVPSLTRLDGRSVIRAAIVNHRTDERDVGALVTEVVRAGRLILGREFDRQTRGACQAARKPDSPSAFHRPPPVAGHPTPGITTA